MLNYFFANFLGNITGFIIPYTGNSVTNSPRGVKSLNHVHVICNNVEQIGVKNVLVYFCRIVRKLMF